MKNQLKKEQLETEIQILENKANSKRQELKQSIAQNSFGYETLNAQPVSLANVRPYSMVYKNDNYKYDDVSCCFIFACLQGIFVKVFGCVFSRSQVMKLISEQEIRKQNGLDKKRLKQATEDFLREPNPVDRVTKLESVCLPNRLPLMVLNDACSNLFDLIRIWSPQRLA